MGPFPHDTGPATIDQDNPAGTDGFEFVEFAHPDPQVLATLFGKMGYKAVAKHKQLDITLYRQGSINYLLNNDPRCHAANFVEEKGSCAPAMACRVVDADHTLRRAVELGATEYTSKYKSIDAPPPWLVLGFPALFY